MKAAVINEYSEDFSVFKYENVAIPELKADEVLIKIKASAVNHCDTDLRKGLFGITQPFPWVMGVDACGEIAELGNRVKGFSIGDRVSPHFMLSCGICQNCQEGKENICDSSEVLGVTVWGGYAEYVKCKPHHLIRIPNSLSFSNAVAGQIPFATAWEALIDVANLSLGETILITAAGGGVGTAAIQVAKLAGAKIIAAAGSDEKLEKVRALGADEIINYTNQDIAQACKKFTDGKGVDCVLEMVGGNILIQTIDAVSAGGRIAIIGAHGGERVEIDFVEFFRKHITVHGAGRSTKAHVSKVLNLMADGRLKPIIHKTFSLKDVGEAHRMMESRNFFGRMVIDV
jgi:NADPH:quinone reductase-like Zn-dependent oxidoreductase